MLSHNDKAELTDLRNKAHQIKARNSLPPFYVPSIDNTRMQMSTIVCWRNAARKAGWSKRDIEIVSKYMLTGNSRHLFDTLTDFSLFGGFT